MRPKDLVFSKCTQQEKKGYLELESFILLLLGMRLESSYFRYEYKSSKKKKKSNSNTNSNLVMKKCFES